MELAFLAWKAANDFPAAHSANVGYFAVDRNGFVASLRSWIDSDEWFDPLYEGGAEEKLLARTIEAGLKQLAPGDSCSLADAEDLLAILSAYSTVDVLYDYGNGWKTADRSAVTYEHLSSPVEPELLRDVLIQIDPQWLERVKYPWLSFDDVAELVWPPKPPNSLAQWQKLIDSARQHLEATLDKWIQMGRFKPAERMARVAQRQFSSLEQLEREFQAWQARHGSEHKD